MCVVKYHFVVREETLYVFRGFGCSDFGFLDGNEGQGSVCVNGNVWEAR